MKSGLKGSVGVVALLLAGGGGVFGQEEDPAPKIEEAVVAAHNRQREKHCAPPVIWSEEVATVARAWIESLAGECSARPAHSYDFGSNTAWHSDAFDFTADEIVDSWFAEIENYDFDDPGFNARAGHFTQVVWAGTNET